LALSCMVVLLGYQEDELAFHAEAIEIVSAFRELRSLVDFRARRLRRG
jgi:hypothetical protein